MKAPVMNFIPAYVILTLKFYFIAPFTYIYLTGIWIDIL